MPTFDQCPKPVLDMAAGLLREYETHQPLIENGVKIDFLFAWPRYDDQGKPIGNAITANGVKALGKARIIPLKDRAKRQGDAEILLDGEWWEHSESSEQRALLDHELHHISVDKNRHGIVKKDDLGRPKLKLRKHDYQFGWFNIIAERHGAFSQENQQATAMMLASGQLYWPLLYEKISVVTDAAEQAAHAVRKGSTP